MKQETVERVGIVRSRKIPESAAMYQRVRAKLSRKFRVWPCPGDERSILYEVVAECKVKVPGTPA